MKKLISMILITVIIIFCLLIFNNNSLSKEQENVDIRFEKEVEQSMASMDIASEIIDADNFIFSALYSHRTVLPRREYDEVFSYIRFCIKNNLSNDEILYINSLLCEGYRLRLISEVYDFWLTTSEDIDFIGKCLEVSDDFWGEHWIENAFNYLTCNKSGVLETREEAEAYLSQGLTTEDIYNANILCRKGEYTIYELLDMRLEGEEWSEICLKASPSDVYKFSTDADEISLLDLQNEKQIKSVMESYFMTDKDELYKKISDAKAQIEEYLEEKCTQKLAQYNIFCDLTETDEENADELKKKIFDNGLRKNELDSLIKRGFELEEIYDVSILVGKDRDIRLRDAVKEVMGGVR